MKIKNILHAAALRFCLLLAIAMGTAAMAHAATHQATNPQPSGEIVNNLTAINELSISWNDTFKDTNDNTTNGLTANTYYDTNGISKAWYNLSDRTIDDKDYLDWKTTENVEQAISFKLNSGTYKLTVKYKSGGDDRGIWVYSGTSRPASSGTGFYVNGTFDGSKEITLSGDQCWTIGAINKSTVRLYSIKVEKTETPTAPKLNAITSPYFWYYNGGSGFGPGNDGEDSNYGNWGKTHYRYLSHNNWISASYTKYVYVNGEEIGGNNSDDNNDYQYGSYIFQKGDAIGFKLDSGKDYRIKVYLVDRESEIDNRVLYKGVNVETATRVDANVYQQTISIMENGAPKETTTRLITYEINKANAGVYWIKNAIDAQLFIGGFEVLPKNYPGFADVFTGENGWYVRDNCCAPIYTALSSTQTVDYPVSGNNVVVYGPDMATNFFDLSGRRTVMLNNGSKFGVRLKKDATLKFTIAGDEGVYAKVTDKDGTQLAANGGGGFADVTYTATADQEVWITGSSEQYVYFSGFEVTQPEPVDPGIEFTAIDKDYVWYPVNSTAPLGNEVFSDDSKTVYIKKDFNRDPNHTENIHKGTITIHGESRTAYRTDKGDTKNKINPTIIGFKIAQGKKGVINWYIEKSGNNNVDLYQSNDPGALGDVLTYNTQLIGDNVNAMQYSFDTTNGEKIYWFKAGTGVNLWFGGFEVLFEEANNGGESLSQNGYTVSTSDYVTNALGTDTHPVFKSMNSNPVGGASMMMYHPGKYDAVAVGGNTNGIIVKMPAGYNFLNVKGYLAGGATINIYKGQPSTNNKNSIPISGSGDIDQTVSLTSLGDVTTNDVYWITSDNVAGAYVSSVKPMTSYDKLQPINVNYIYKVNGKPANGVQGDGRVKFVDQNGSATTKVVDENGSVTTEDNPSMNVIGTAVTPVTIENGSDFFAVKVDQGPLGAKTGYIKVYFNGGNAGNHVLQELPLDDPMYAGWNSTYDRDTHIITFNGGKESGGRGWWLGDGGRDLSAYNKLNIEATTTDANTNMLQVVVQSANGARAVIPYDAVNKRFLGDLTDTDLWVPEGDATFDIKHVTQIYIQDTTAADEYTSHVEIKSARLMNKPIVIAKGTDENSDAGYTELFGGKIYNLDNNKSAFVYEYPFDLSKADQVPQLTWITGAGSGTINIAAIEVLYDTQHAKVVDWYVNKDTKMIVGSDDPQFTMSFNGETLKYPSGYDEYVTFYMSSGRQANVSFIMPEAVREEYDWEQAVAKAGSLVVNVKDSKGNYTDYVDEVETDKNITDNKDKLAYSYGKHTIFIDGDKGNHKGVDKVGIGSGDNISFQEPNTQTYNRHNGISADRKKINSKGDLYKWYTYSYDLPSNITASDYTNKNFCAGVSITATQKEAGGTATETVGGKTGEWKIYMRFVSFKAPVATAVTSGDKTTGVTVTAGQSGSIYYTIDSSEPDNLGKTGFDASHSSTNTYYSGEVDVNDKNCIFKAAQYITTDFLFYDDISKGKDESARDNVLKVVSSDLAVTNDISSVVYVKNTSLVDDQIFNVQEGGYMLTIPTGTLPNGTLGWQGDEYKDKDGKGKTEDNKPVHYYDQPFTSTPFLYLTLGGKDWPFYNGSPFDVCGTNWMASNDGGLHTYLDSYQNKMDVDGAAYPEWWIERTVDEDGEYVKDSEGNWVLEKEKKSGTQNQNPYTECNGGVGGIDTEDGGMFLQPVSGTMLRFEPEYDGVITVWLRQNGCLDNNTQELGTFNRRPVYVMDENGRIMRRSTIRPTADHYMGINGVWAINSSVCEQRSQVEHTWLYEVAQQAFANHPLYASRFNDGVFPNRWVEDGLDHSGHILYGWWYKGFDLDATRSSISSASHVSRYNYMEPELLYRSDGIFNMEMNRLGLKNAFAKYGFELPNFQYVRYRIPVKAGKTYYIAGRGTKNGFSAIRFDALKPNTNTNDGALYGLRYTDNPAVVENSNDQSDDYLKVTSNWDNNGERQDSQERHENDLTGKSEAEVLQAYSSLTKIEINDENNDNAAKINGVSYNGGNDYSNGNLVGQTVDVELTRTFRAYNWHPIILPFSLSETRVEQYFGVGTKILYLDPYVHTMNNQLDEVTGKSYVSAYSQALEGTKLSFTLHRYQMLYANTPAFICPTFEWPEDKKTDPATNEVKKNLTMSGSTAVTKITFKRVTIDGSNSRNFRSGTDHSGYIGYPISNDYEIVGSYDSRIQYGDIYFVNNKTPDGGKDGNVAELVHYKGNGDGVTMKGTRVWIRPRSGAVNAAPIMTVGSRGFSDFEEDSELTGISDVVADDYVIEGYDIEDDGVYDLLGRKVGQGSLDGLIKGIYIFHGRKVYVK